jgi:CrcB protein
VTFRPADTRPAHLEPTLLAAVFLGGTVGTALRAALTLAVPPAAGVPFVTVAINLVGAFALGALLSALAAWGPDTGRRRSLRVLLGTGLLGGFTTYSALAVDTAGLLGSGHPLQGLGYAIGTVLGGLLAAWAGTLLPGRGRR